MKAEDRFRGAPKGRRPEEKGSSCATTGQSPNPAMLSLEWKDNGYAHYFRRLPQGDTFPILRRSPLSGHKIMPISLPAPPPGRCCPRARRVATKCGPQAVPPEIGQPGEESNGRGPTGPLSWSLGEGFQREGESKRPPFGPSFPPLYSGRKGSPRRGPPENVI